MKPLLFKIAIVGLGPKGLYGFERLLARLNSNLINDPLEIHLFNKTRFMGSGDVYRSDQPGYLLMNFSNKHINMWPNEAPQPLVQHPERFSQYLAREQNTTPAAIDSLYASRATVGAYLEQGFAELCNNVPENVLLDKHIAEVNSIEKQGGNYVIGFKEEEKTLHLDGFQQILITTGHQRHKKCIKPKVNRIRYIYPVDETLKEVTQHHTVAMKGLGLTFIDAALALTEGRGGRFTETTNGNYTYSPSGKEPNHIYPFSKSGWPMLPKYNFDTPENEPPLYVESIQPSTDAQLSFTNDILPLLHQDMEFAYYNTLIAHKQVELIYHTDYEQIKAQIDAFHQAYPEYPEFSLKRLLEPEFNPKLSTHQNILEYLTAFTEVAPLNIVHEAQLRAAAVWKRVSPVFNTLYSFSGLDPASHEEFDKHYFGKLNRIAFGPPPDNLKKIIALAQAGIVDFRYARNPNLKCRENGISLNNGKSQTFCDVLINARIPKNSIQKDATGLFLNLCRNELARPYINHGKHTTYASGTVEIDRNGKLINARGIPENITLYGTPTEGLVHDNDTLSRTRNNFADPWAQAVIKQLTIQKYETFNPLTTSFTFGKSMDVRFDGK